MSLRNKLEKLLDSNPFEPELHEFIAAQPTILARCIGDPSDITVQSKINIHKYEMDFALRRFWASVKRYEWTLVEIERSSHKHFTAKGDPTAAVTHALRQVNDWRAWLEDNLAYARTILPDIEPAPGALIIIGRRATLNHGDQRRLGSLVAGHYRTRIHTYDTLLENCDSEE